MRPVLLGMNCPVGGEPLSPEGHSGRRLIKIMGRDAFDGFERINLLDERVWSLIAARERADEMMTRLRGRRVAVLGDETWQALMKTRRRRWFETKDSRGTVYTSLPHPSGRSLVLNRLAMRRAMRLVLRRMAGLP